MFHLTSKMIINGEQIKIYLIIIHFVGLISFFFFFFFSSFFLYFKLTDIFKHKTQISVVFIEKMKQESKYLIIIVFLIRVRNITTTTITY